MCASGPDEMAKNLPIESTTELADLMRVTVVTNRKQLGNFDRSLGRKARP
jgi:hypothetical protein